MTLSPADLATRVFRRATQARRSPAEEQHTIRQAASEIAAGAPGEAVDAMGPVLDSAGGDPTVLLGQLHARSVANMLGLKDPYEIAEVPVERRRSYFPGTPDPMWRDMAAYLKDVPGALASWREYKSRVKTLLNNITDEQLDWALGRRLEELAANPGIVDPVRLRLVNAWSKFAAAIAEGPSHRDFDGSSLSPTSLMKIFTGAFDREASIVQYQFVSAQVLNNYLPLTSRFMGIALHTRIIYAALGYDVSHAVSIWAAEEARHASTGATLYNLTRTPDQPELKPQSIASRAPVISAKAAESMMAGRTLAELAAATAYVTLMCNAKDASPTFKAFEGMNEDEVYHDLIMSVVNLVAYGTDTTFKRFASILRHSMFGGEKATDKIEHRHKGYSPLALMEMAYSLKQIDRRVQRYLDKLLSTPEGRETMERLVGPRYLTEEASQEAIARGDIIPAVQAHQFMSADMSSEAAAELQLRFPETYGKDRPLPGAEPKRRFLRKGKSSEPLTREMKRELDVRVIQDVLGRFRTETIPNPTYWKNEAKFTELTHDEGSTTLGRALSDGGSLTLRFSEGQQPVATLSDVAGHVQFEASLDALSLPQIGALRRAEDVSSMVRDLEASKNQTDLKPDDLIRRMGPNPTDAMVLVSAFQEASPTK
jgi:hypothetical protein